jgi:ribosome-binding factor A
MKYRPLRLGKLIEEELSLVISRELELGNALATITKIDVTDKSDFVRVSFSVFPSSEDTRVLKILDKEKSRLRQLLMKKVNTRIMPMLQFELDHGSENAAAIEKALLDDQSK